ncbi:MAG: hypothetical protein EOP62_02365 [Sphingomonadales bacterium]|nr:MAG: hypothetical protein EOP62_02365 [Sphingomonadales bacterium]
MTFPIAKVIAALTSELTQVAQSEAFVRGISLPTAHSALMKAAVPIDSLSTVDALCVLDTVLGFKLKESIVRTGGYDSVEEALNHMVPRIQAAWTKRKKKK